MITDREFHTLLGKALDAIEGKSAAEQQTRAAQQATTRSQLDAARFKTEGERAKADADAKVKEQEKAAADLAAKIAKDTADHEAKMKAAAADRKRIIDAAGQTLDAINAEVRKLRAERDALTGQIAKHKASLADAAATL